MSEQPKSIKENVLAAITAGKVHMRPRWHFVLQAALVLAGVILVILASLFIGSFILFILHQNGTWFALPAFGQQGISELLSTVPILLIAVAIIFVIILQLLVRRYAFAYGKPALYTVLGIVAVIIAGSLLIERGHVHESLFEQARDRHLPLAGKLYLQYGDDPAQNITPGRIIRLSDKGFEMVDNHGHFFQVQLDSHTRLPYGSDFDHDDYVIVLGPRSNDTIMATGVIEYEADERLFSPVK